MNNMAKLETGELEEWASCLIIAKRDSEWESPEYWFYRHWILSVIRVIDRRYSRK